MIFLWPPSHTVSVFSKIMMDNNTLANKKKIPVQELGNKAILLQLPLPSESYPTINLISMQIQNTHVKMTKATQGAHFCTARF